MKVEIENWHCGEGDPVINLVDVVNLNSGLFVRIGY